MLAASIYLKTLLIKNSFQMVFNWFSRAMFFLLPYQLYFIINVQKPYIKEGQIFFLMLVVFVLWSSKTSFHSLCSVFDFFLKYLKTSECDLIIKIILM